MAVDTSEQKKANNANPDHTKLNTTERTLNTITFDVDDEELGKNVTYQPDEKLIIKDRVIVD